MPPTEIASWLQKNMDAKNWGVRETARRAHISHPIISDILNGGQPSFETCKALANLFGVKPEFLFRVARLLDPIPPENETIQEIAFVVSSLPKDEQAGILEFAKMRARIALEKGQYRVGERIKRKSETSGSN